MLGYIIPAIYWPATNCIATDNHGNNPKAGEIYNANRKKCISEILHGVKAA